MEAFYRKWGSSEKPLSVKVRLASDFGVQISNLVQVCLGEDVFAVAGEGFGDVADFGVGGGEVGDVQGGVEQPETGRGLLVHFGTAKLLPGRLFFSAQRGIQWRQR